MTSEPNWNLGFSYLFIKGQINVVTKIFKFLAKKSQFCDFLTAG